MLHTERIWSITTVDDPEELVRQLKNHSWTLCTGFEHRGILWLNDSTSEDAIQEYAVVRRASLSQIESITVSWCLAADLLDYINDFAGSKEEETEIWTIIRSDQVQTDHEPCHLCR